MEMTLPVILLFPLWLFPSIFSRIVFSSPFPFLPFCFILLDDSLLYYITSHPSNNITPIFWNLTSHHLLTDYIQFQVTENCSNGLKQQGDFIDSFNWKAEKLGLFKFLPVTSLSGYQSYRFFVMFILRCFIFSCCSKQYLFYWETLLR